MKKVKLNVEKLQLNKEKITSLQNIEMNQLQGGYFSDGCTDGCSPLGSIWNCTQADCSANCSQTFCPLSNTGHPGTLC
ncbi:hypothetical protein F0L74_24700 [Chitinophaga agrisoli]|uniref:Natural product n=1 Tax=Chitinophaga agrisoli TaxID=2607653 RepID=A0A5B2VK91_9BACT|nr:class I lanthipeptide [Chitinophaga agrisoli]KAA2239405.1 hypothetical protein F0L74_24700 [Chitinophaga agrisoli]